MQCKQCGKWFVEKSVDEIYCSLECWNRAQLDGIKYHLPTKIYHNGEEVKTIKDLTLRFMDMATVPIKIVAPLEPVPFPRPSSNGKRRYNPPRYSEFKDALGLFATKAMNGQAPFTGAVKLRAEVYKNIAPTALKFGDWDNHAKAICDALNGICYHDDRQITEAYIRLLKGEPRIIIELEELA